MLEYSLIAAASFFASFFSFYSGFGLGTVLMPVSALFFSLAGRHLFDSRRPSLSQFF